MYKTVRHWVGQNWIGALVCFVLGAALLSLGYYLGQRTVPQEVKGFQAVNFPQLSPSPTSGMHLPPQSVSTPTVPANATPEMKEFMANRSALMEKMQEARKQGSSPQAFAQFQKDNADLLKKQRDLAQIIAQQQAKNPMPTPPPLQIPPNASPQLKAYLTARDQMMRDQITFMNQHRNDDPATRQAAMQQWRQQNASRFQEMQKEAQAMSQQNAPVQPPVKKTGT